MEYIHVIRRKLISLTEYIKEIVGSIHVLPPDFAAELAPCTGMRNRLVHEYDKIDDQAVFDRILILIEMVNKYIKNINQYLSIS